MVMAGGGNSPTLRGFWKWSIRRSLYIRFKHSQMNVVAAIIVKGDSILICQRKAEELYPGKWEFPGGKVEPNEELRAALARELEEELAIQAVIGAEIERYDYT